MAIYVAETIFYEKHLKHITVAIAEKGVVVARGAKNQ